MKAGLYLHVGAYPFTQLCYFDVQSFAVLYRLSEGPTQGSPFITHLGDGDPNLQPHPQYLLRSSTPEDEQTLQLVIPELDHSAENSLNNSGTKKENTDIGESEEFRTQSLYGRFFHLP